MATPRTRNGRRSTGKRVSAEKYGQSDRDVEIVEHAPAPNGHHGSDDLAQMNANYAVVKVGGRTRVMSFEESAVHPGCKVPVFARVQDFLSFHLKRKKTIIDARGNGRKVGIGRWWFEHDDRTQYDEVLYAPGITTREGIYNLWRGFSCEARKGNCDLYLRHLYDNICSGIDAHYQYLLNWMARGVQLPDRQGEVAIVLRGEEGTGKGVFAKTYGRLFGPHFWHVSNSHHLVGHFNSHLQQCSVLFADEAFFAGDRSYESSLKALITEETLLIEPKGVDPYTTPNRIHLIIASNADWVIPAGAEARRFFMLDVSATRRQDRDYFGAIGADLADGGREALLFELLHRDLRDFDVGAIPDTLALAEQRAYSRRDIHRLVEHLAHEGQLPACHPIHANVAVTSGEGKGDGFYAEAKNLVPDLKHMSSIRIADKLKNDWGCKPWKSGLQRGIEFPALSEFRRLFDEKHGIQQWPVFEPVEWTLTPGAK
jgi:Family of unknown function (DUF5906)